VDAHGSEKMKCVVCGIQLNPNELGEIIVNGKFIKLKWCDSCKDKAGSLLKQVGTVKQSWMSQAYPTYDSAPAYLTYGNDVPEEIKRKILKVRNP